MSAAMPNLVAMNIYRLRLLLHISQPRDPDPARPTMTHRHWHKTDGTAPVEIDLDRYLAAVAMRDQAMQRFAGQAAFLGIARAGSVQVDVSPLRTLRELAHRLNDAGCKTIVTGSARHLAHHIGPTWRGRDSYLHKL